MLVCHRENGVVGLIIDPLKKILGLANPPSNANTLVCKHGKQNRKGNAKL